MKIRFADQEYDVRFRFIHNSAEAKIDAMLYGIKPKLALDRIVGETVCIVKKEGKAQVIGRAFQSNLERFGFKKEKGKKEAFKEALKKLGVPRDERKDLWTQYHCAA